jgi:hypothetical protein
MKILSDATINKTDFEAEANKQAALHAMHGEKFKTLSDEFVQHKFLIACTFCANAILTLALKFF